MTGLRAAARTVDLTPLDFPNIRLGGFGFNRRASGVLHPLEAAVLYLTDGEEEVALVTVDSVGLMRPTVERIRERVTRLADRRRVLVCSTHSHAAPDTMGYWGRSLLWLLPMTCGIEPRYVDQLVERIAGAVDEVAQNAAPARLRATTFEVEPTLFTNHRTKGLRDHTGALLLVDDEDGAPLATLLGFAAHPEGLWEQNRRISPDYPHHVRAVLREEGCGVPLFFSGALGGMLTPDIRVKAKTPEREGEIERIGRALGKAAADAAKSAPALEKPVLRFASRNMTLPVANWRFRLLRRLGVLRRADLDRQVETEMALVRLGGLRLLTVPGEALPELGVELRAALGGSTAPTFLLCLGNDELGYMLPPAQFHDRHYRYEASMSLGPETAPLVVRMARELADAVASPSRGGG